MHYETFKYEPQILSLGEGAVEDILSIRELLSMGELETLEAYSRFYRLLQSVVVKMVPSDVTYDVALLSAVEYVTSHYDESFSVADLAKHCCVSESSLYHLFQKELGQTPVKFINSIRINVAIEHLENSNLSIATVSEMVGFHSENHFRKVLSELSGITPLQYMKHP
jgi:transcriptional regulator GlxA family with amidase domain